MLKIGWNSSSITSISVIPQNCGQSLSVPSFRCILIHFEANRTILKIITYMRSLDHLPGLFWWGTGSIVFVSFCELVLLSCSTMEPHSSFVLFSEIDVLSHPSYTPDPLSHSLTPSQHHPIPHPHPLSHSPHSLPTPDLLLPPHSLCYFLTLSQPLHPLPSPQNHNHLTGIFVIVLNQGV